MVAAFLLVAAVLLVHLAVLPQGFRLARTTTGGRVRRRFAVTSSPPPQPAATSTRAPPPPPHVPDPLVMKQVALLVAMWGKIAFPTEDDQETNFRLGDYGLDRNSVKGFLQHFQTCKDCAADNAFLMAAQDEADGADMLRLSNVYFPMCVEKDSDDEWGLFDPDLLGENGGTGENERTIFPVENDDAIVLADTKEWVRKVIADFGVCPFTIDPNRAGIPMGGVRYTVSRAKGPDEAFYRYWEEVLALLSVPEREISTVLLVFPELELFGNFELFEAYCESLGDALCSSTMCMEDEIQLVFFHPRYQFRDGQARTGEDNGAANFARRSPWPMINILRTPQVKAAQKGVPTGVVYKQNEERLSAVGTRTLEDMLYTRNWAELPAHAAHAKSARAAQETAGVVDAPAVPALAPAAAVPAGVCPFPHEQMAAAAATAATGAAPSATTDAQAVLEAAKRRALEEMQQRQEEMARRQQELGLLPSAEASRLQPVVAGAAGQEEEVGAEEEEVVDVLEGVTAALVNPLEAVPAPAPAPAAAPVNLAMADAADVSAFLDALDQEASTSGARLAELIARTDEEAAAADLDPAAGGDAWETDYLLLAEEAERWLEQEEAARAAAAAAAEQR